jgi:hypothetical protein
MYVCHKNMKNKQKEWHPATKPLKKERNIGRKAKVLQHEKMNKYLAGRPTDR